VKNKTNVIQYVSWCYTSSIKTFLQYKHSAQTALKTVTSNGSTKRINLINWYYSVNDQNFITWCQGYEMVWQFMRKCTKHEQVKN